MKKKKNKRMGLLFLLFSLNLLLVPKWIEYSKEKQEIKKVEQFISSPQKVEGESYIGVLEIPKIKLKRGFYNLSSKKNHVDKNIQMIETSLMPTVQFSNLILAAHSGNSKVSFFKNLYKLEIKDIVYIYYNEKKYTYELVDIYDEKKDGLISIKREFHQTNLTLITCDQKNKKLQNVYIFKLINDAEEFQQ